MSAKGTEAAKPAEGAKKEGEASAQAAGEGAGGGGIKAFLPLILCVVLMPALAYATTMFLVVPKLQNAISQGSKGAADEHGEHGDAPAAEAGSHGAKEAHGAAPKDAHGAKGPSKSSGKAKVSVPLDKVLVNVAGSMGTRYLLAKFTLVSEKGDFKETVDKNTDQLKDLSMSIMGSKTITDLEKPGARNVIRSEILSAFNTVLGSGTVQELFFTEFAIQ